MSPLMFLLTAITVTLIALVITSVVKSNASLERGRLAHNERAAYLRANRGKPAGRASRAPQRRQVGAAAPRPAIGAGADDKASRTVAATAGQQTQAADLPPLGARIRLDDGRTGTVAAIERIARATRVHLELDGGGRGHVDLPDTARPAPAPAPVPVPQPEPRPAPALTLVRSVPATAPVPAARPTPAPAAATAAAAASTTVRLGGFSMPVTPTGRRS